MDTNTTLKTYIHTVSTAVSTVDFYRIEGNICGVLLRCLSPIYIMIIQVHRSHILMLYYQYSIYRPLGRFLPRLICQRTANHLGQHQLGMSISR